MKMGMHRSGEKNMLAIEKAFAFVAWMEQLARIGDPLLSISSQPQLEPTYAINTILTCAQRAKSAPEAQRAFDMLAAWGHAPDVFAYTALIDVLAMNRQVHAAFQVLSGETILN
jgi:pentatricopeptide repeat protein